MTADDDRLSALLNAAVDAMVLADDQGRITRFNHAAERLFGYQQDEVLGCNLNMLMPEPYRAEHDGYIARYQHTGVARIIGSGRQVTARRKDGTLVPIDLSVGEFRTEGELGYVGILRDITQRQRQAAQLKHQADELSLIFDNAPTPILISRLSGQIIKANLACCTLLGSSPQQMQALRQTDLLHPEDQAAGVQFFEQLVANTPLGRSELRYLRSDGTVLHTITHAALSPASEELPTLIISEIVDRSALFSVEREADQLRSRLAHAGRIGTLGEMVSGIAHEVNQPLTAIANYANACRRLLQAGQTSPEELITTLEKISSQAERAGQVIRGLRNLTRKRDAVKEPLDCNQLISEVAKLLEFELRNSGWRLLLKLAPELPPVLGDGVQLQQVVLNLVRNGIEAMGERASGDFIRVETRRVDAASIEILVNDCGPGISSQVAEHLFEPFYTTKQHGMGLGLSICQSIASAHGGELSSREVPGAGACFVLRLPTL